MKAVEFLVLCLGVWRISSLLVNEGGPWDIFRKVRSAIGFEHDPPGIPTVAPDGFWGELFSCVWCISMWVGGVLTLSYFLAPGAVFWILLPFAVSGAAIFIDRWSR